MKNYIALSLLFISFSVFSQSQIKVTNLTADEILKGNYNPTDYSLANTNFTPEELPVLIQNSISPDSLKAYITKLSRFGTRNSGSDTTSATQGIGAARKYIFQKFQQFQTKSNNRLQPGYLRFTNVICNQWTHKNVIAVLPGTDVSNHEVILIEGHMDSRCDVSCDVNCKAEGVEDNATGTALVMELARVMSKYQFNHTILFIATTAEEQGLLGADAMSDYIQKENIPLKAVFNNDVIGGIICGETSSPPSCPGLNDVDSLNTRIFSFGGFNASSKSLARYSKLQYKESIPNNGIKLSLHIMTNEDRIGRGGDHIPFRQKGFPAIRFTSANEHGDASNGPNYTDRQHTEDDILGVDTDGDNVVDSFFVDFNYLKRNSVINATAAANCANSPKTPSFKIDSVDQDLMRVTITSPEDFPTYRIGLRTTTNDWDSVYTSTSKSMEIAINDSNAYYVSVANVNEYGIESLFSEEQLLVLTKVSEKSSLKSGIEIWQNKPNPFDESTIIPVFASKEHEGKTAVLKITDLNGNIVFSEEQKLNSGLNEWPYHHGFGALGTFVYSVYVNNQLVGAKKMTFAY
jgi:hypothetical protein